MIFHAFVIVVHFISNTMYDSPIKGTYETHSNFMFRMKTSYGQKSYAFLGARVEQS